MPETQLAMLASIDKRLDGIHDMLKTEHAENRDDHDAIHDRISRHADRIRVVESQAEVAKSRWKWATVLVAAAVSGAVSFIVKNLVRLP